jgi:2-succinyl-5-enolpyruvyl-6-hydroxy-3-cyclohexene-1-carboxylate synthase
VRIDRDDMEVWRDGETKAEYLAAHQRCIRRLRRILARKREMEKWCEKWDAMHDRFVKEVDALQAIKPEGSVLMVDSAFTRSRHQQASVLVTASLVIPSRFSLTMAIMTNEFRMD